MNDISRNNINISNLLSFIDKCENYLIKMPFILSKKESKDQFETCIKGFNMIYNYLNNLKKSPIKNTEFSNIIDNSFEEFHSLFNALYNKEGESQNNCFNFIKQFYQPYDEKSIIEPYKKQTIKVTINNFIDSKYIPK